MMRTRPEVFGAIVQSENPPALVSIDRVLAKSLNIEGGALWNEESPGLAVEQLSAPTEVHVAVTDRCPAGCVGCYADATPQGHEPTERELRDRLQELRDLGVFRVAFGGGEGALRPGVGALAAYARSIGLSPTITTSGLGIDKKNASEFRPFSQVNVSYDGRGEVYRKVRGYDGSFGARSALLALADAGISIGINTVVTRDNVDHIETIAALGDELSANELQLVRYKPTGRAKAGYLARRLLPEQITGIPSLLRTLTHDYKLSIRVDCAMLPFLVADGTIEPAELTRFGVMGCEAGRSLLSVKADGRALPCSFWSDSQSSSYGHQGLVTLERRTDFRGDWDHDPTLGELQRYHRDAPEPCASCTYQSQCRGGCRVVSHAIVGSSFAPDPECPRVRVFRDGVNLETHQKPCTDET